MNIIFRLFYGIKKDCIHLKNRFKKDVDIMIKRIRKTNFSPDIWLTESLFIDKLLRLKWTASGLPQSKAQRLIRSRSRFVDWTIPGVAIEARIQRLFHPWAQVLPMCHPLYPFTPTSTNRPGTPAAWLDQDRLWYNLSAPGRIMHLDFCIWHFVKKIQYAKNFFLFKTRIFIILWGRVMRHHPDYIMSFT